MPKTVRKILSVPPRFLLTCLRCIGLCGVLSAGLLSQWGWGQAATPTPVLSAGGIVNNASYALSSSNVAPGTIAAIFGTNLTDGSSCVPASGCFPSFDNEGRLRTTMSGAQVFVNGISVPIFYATPTQLGVQIPPDLPGTSATVRVSVKGVSSVPYTLRLDPFSPGIFTVNQDGRGPATIAHSDGSPVNASNPAKPGEIVVLYATGLGQATPIVTAGALPRGPTTTLTTPMVTVDDLPALVEFSGLSGCCVGLNQINLMVPVSVRMGNDLPVVLSIGGYQSNPVTIAVSENPLVASPPFISFGDVPVNTRGTASVTVRNRGNAGLSITHTEMITETPGFTISGLSLPRRLEPGQSVTFSVSFSPTTPGNALARLSMHSDAVVGVVVPFVANATFQPAVTTTSLPQGRQGDPYSATVTATGGQTPYTWSITAGALPAGLALNPNSGLISGSPTSSGTSTFTVRVSDANRRAHTAELTITVAPGTLIPALRIITSSLHEGRQNAPYGVALVATGGQTPYTWSVSSGSLPAGLTLDPNAGVISGTPTSSGTSSFIVRATDVNSQTVTQALSLTTVQVTPLAIVTSSLPSATQNTQYTATLAATGGQAPYTWAISAGTLPVGLALAPGSGVISGTPTGAGTSTFTVRLTDVNFQAVTRTFTLVVAQVVPPPALAINSLPAGSLSAPYNATLTPTSGQAPYTWSIIAGSLPPGLTLASSTGVISGIPTSLGTSNFTVRLTDANRQGDALDFSITIDEGVAVALTWTASSSVVAGYNVYRGIARGGPYTKVNAQLVTDTAYRDRVARGRTYFYVVTAINSLGYESAYSNEASAAVP